MALPVIANTFRVTFNWHSDAGAEAHNVMHFRSAGANSDDIFDALDAAVTDDMWQQTCTTVNVESLDILPLDGTSSTINYSAPVDARWAGTRAGEFAPALAAIVRLKTGQRGRSHRGRVYLPFVAEAAQAAGVLAGTTAVDLQQAWQAFDTALLADSVEPVVASYKLASADSVINYDVPAILGTMKRRQDALRT